jgi:hypothetical protein
VLTVTGLPTFRGIVIVYFRNQAAEEVCPHDAKDEGITIFEMWVYVYQSVRSNFQENMNFRNLLYLEGWPDILWYDPDTRNQKQSSRLLTCYYAN